MLVIIIDLHEVFRKRFKQYNDMLNHLVRLSYCFQMRDAGMGECIAHTGNLSDVASKSWVADSAGKLAAFVVSVTYILRLFSL